MSVASILCLLVIAVCVTGGQSLTCYSCYQYGPLASSLDKCKTSTTITTDCEVCYTMEVKGTVSARNSYNKFGCTTKTEKDMMKDVSISNITYKYTFCETDKCNDPSAAQPVAGKFLTCYHCTKTETIASSNDKCTTSTTIMAGCDVCYTQEIKSSTYEIKTYSCMTKYAKSKNKDGTARGITTKHTFCETDKCNDPYAAQPTGGQSLTCYYCTKYETIASTNDKCTTSTTRRIGCEVCYTEVTKNSRYQMKRYSCVRKAAKSTLKDSVVDGITTKYTFCETNKCNDPYAAQPNAFACYYCFKLESGEYPYPLAKCTTSTTISIGCEVCYTMEVKSRIFEYKIYSCTTKVGKSSLKPSSFHDATTKYTFCETSKCNDPNSAGISYSSPLLVVTLVFASICYRVIG